VVVLDLNQVVENIVAFYDTAIKGFLKGNYLFTHFESDVIKRTALKEFYYYATLKHTYISARRQFQIFR